MIPLPLRIGLLVLATTAFYTYVGQLVPQKEVQPPTETVIRADLTTADMVTVGRQIMEGKGLCMTCHTIGRSGALRFPDLDGVASRAATRVPGLSDVRSFRAVSCTHPTPSSSRVSTRACRSSTSPRSASPIRRSSA